MMNSKFILSVVQARDGAKRPRKWLVSWWFLLTTNLKKVPFTKHTHLLGVPDFKTGNTLAAADVAPFVPLRLASASKTTARPRGRYIALW